MLTCKSVRLVRKGGLASGFRRTPSEVPAAEEFARAEIALRLQAQIDQAEEDIVRLTAEAQDDDYLETTYGDLLDSGSMTEQEVRDAESERLRDATERRQEAIDKANEMGLILRNPSVLTNVPFDAAEQIPDRMRAARENLKQRFDEWCEKYIDNKLQQQILTNSPPPPLDKPPADLIGDNRRYYAFNQEDGTWCEANLWSDGDELLPG